MYCAEEEGNQSTHFKDFLCKVSIIFMSCLSLSLPILRL